MKHLLSILLICSIGFTQELTVDGNLNVTGNIQNQTIDSLLQVIQDLQSQLSVLQGGNNISTGIYQLTFEGEHTDFIPSQNLSVVTGVSSDWYKVEVLSYSTSTISGSSSHSGYLTHYDEGQSFQSNYSYGVCSITTGNGGVWGIQSCEPIFSNDSHPYVYYTHHGWDGNYSSTTLTVLITTSSFDVQQRKPGLQSKDKETVK